jgi:serine protease Do
MRKSMKYLTAVSQVAFLALLATPASAFQAQAAPELRALLGSGGSYLGVGVAEITSERAKALSLREEHGVEITRVADDSPAAKGGLKAGDVVLEYNGQRVEGIDQFMRLVRETPAGRDVRLSVSRNGAAQDVVVRTGARKAWLSGKLAEGAVEIPRIEMPNIRIPDVPHAMISWRSSFLGIEGESLSPQLAEFFGVKEGVLVRSVTKDSAGEKAGLRAGDVIVRVDETNVSNPREISAAVRSARSKKSVALGVVREKRDLSITLPVEETGAELRH